ncbi:cold shock domain-containing protein [Streptacidiphilus jiangxiensis]|uniref:'Cold-shock' DNA-binding domain-containing protein n=1 Tax=Streptacidiphilus jiangxiensis TaxID=235985 RepID=A0A1H7UNX1_STRJI|nr:cold shock domain-containing protein [Streptacidiphilus jiangxiensis]SEL98328.1 'Cold-shock' DNA-binding domain-containing protein [Streptacidiphilus jiangxiensis]
MSLGRLRNRTANGYGKLVEEKTVTFNVEQGYKGPQASDIVRI